jgi:hypothetical protein
MPANVNRIGFVTSYGGLRLPDLPLYALREIDDV